MEPNKCKPTHCEDSTRAPEASISSLEPSLQEDPRENHPKDDGSFSKPTPNWNYCESEEPIGYDELFDGSEENQAEEIDNSGQREKELTCSTLSEPCSNNPTDCENCTRDPDASIMNLEPSLQENPKENHPEDDSSVTESEDNKFHHNKSQGVEQASKEYTASSTMAFNMDKTFYYQDSIFDSLDSNFSLSGPILQDCPKEIHSGVPDVCDECEASDGENTDDEWDSSCDSGTSELLLKNDEFQADEIHYNDLENNEGYEKSMEGKFLKVSMKRTAERELSDEERYIKCPRLFVEEANGGTIHTNEPEPKENKQGEDNHQENVNYNLTINNYYNGKQSESIHTATNSGYNKEETDKENWNVNYNLTINNYYNGKQSESIHTATNSGYNKEETDKEN